MTLTFFSSEVLGSGRLCDERPEKQTLDSFLVATATLSNHRLPRRRVRTLHI